MRRVEGCEGRWIWPLREAHGATGLQVRVHVGLHPGLGHDGRLRHFEVCLASDVPLAWNEQGFRWEHASEDQGRSSLESQH